MEQEEGSGSKPCHQNFSKIGGEQGVNGEGTDMESLEDDFKSLLIVPSNSKYSDLELLSDAVEIHSDLEVSSFEEQGWCKITRNSDHCSSTLQNESLDVNCADGNDVSTEDTIIPGPLSDGYSSCRFKKMPINESSKKMFKILLDSEHVKCSICLNIWHDVVTVSPCLHNFCNGCFSEWSRRYEEKHAIVLCPHCISDVQYVGRNHFLHRIEEEIRQSDYSLRRSDEELGVINSYPLIKSLPAINYRKKPRTKRSRALPEEDNYGANLECAQCGKDYGGFQCNQNTVHLQCNACWGMMPSRTNISVPQHCIGCDRDFCGAYWHSQQITRGDSYHMCALKPIEERSITRIPFLAHEWNRREQNITERCIWQMGKTLQDVVSEWVAKLNTQEIDRTRMPLNHAEMITSGTEICNECYDKLVSFLLYWFRVCLPKYDLPGDAAQRKDCWYGYTCRTQKHNNYHARKLNHVCPPTKGGNEN